MASTANFTATIALAAVVAAVFMGWKARAAASADDKEKYQRTAIAAAAVAGVAAFLYYRHKSVMNNIASQYLISVDDF